MSKTRLPIAPASFAREFSSAPGPQINGCIYAPAHPPCQCIRPSDIPETHPAFATLRDDEQFHRTRGNQLWIVVFRNDAAPTTHFLLTPLTRPQPTTEELSRLCNWAAAQSLLAMQVGNGTLHGRDAPANAGYKSTKGR
jgi:hypothetical protein